MNRKIVFVSAVGLAWGLLLLAIWPMVQAVAPNWNWLYIPLSYATGLGFFAFGTVAADGAENSRAGQWIVLIIGILYGVSNIGAYNPMALLSVGPTVWGAAVALYDNSATEPFRLRNPGRVWVVGGIGMLLAFLGARFWFPYQTIEPSRWLDAVAVVVVLLQHIAIIAYLLGSVKGDSWVFRYSKGLGAILALIHNLAYHSPGSVTYQVALLTVMLLLAADDYRKQQNPPSP